MTSFPLVNVGTPVLLLLLGLSTSVTVAADGYQLTISPRGTQIKAVNSGVMFTCNCIPPVDVSTAPLSITWHDPGNVPITATRGRVFVERADVYSVRLYITRLSDSDAGVYTCAAQVPGDATSGSGQTSISQRVGLFLYEEIEFADTPVRERILAGQNALLQCVVTGLPKPEVSWRFNRQRIASTDDDPGPRQHTTSSKYEVVDGGLLVKHVDVWDNGTFECRAEVASHANVRLRHIQLEVLYPPTITRAPTADDVIKGRNATLRCYANGNPPVRFEWFREKKMSDMIVVKVRLSAGSDSYVISDVRADDEDRYICRATNEFGAREASVDVRMLVPPVIDPLLRAEFIVKEGSTLSVTCEASGTPAPRIYWARDGSSSHNHTTDDRLLASLMESGMLKIANKSPGVSEFVLSNVMRSYSGHVTCIAENIAGSSSLNFSIIVEYSPTVRLEGRRQLGWPGETRNITCIGRARPAPSMNWFRGEQYLNDNDVYHISTLRTADEVTSVLTIRISSGGSSVGGGVGGDEGLVTGGSSHWLYGSYSCIAKNIHGYVTDSATLTQALVPLAPRNVSVLSETETSIRITAAAAGNDDDAVLAVTSWRVKYELAMSTGSSFVKTFNHSDDVIMTVDGLESGCTYAFSLSAGNAVGYGSAVKFRVTTLQFPAPAVSSSLPPSRGEDSLDAEESLHDDDNVYHYQPVRPAYTDRGQPKLSRESADGRRRDDDDVDYPSSSGSNGDRAPQFVERASLMLSLGVGAGVVLVIVLVTLTSVIMCRRRHKSRAASLPPTVDSYALVPLQPHPGPDMDRTSPRSTSARPCSRQSSVRIPVQSPSVQQLEWQRMMHSRSTECDDVIDSDDGGVDDVIPSRLPPPPAFLVRSGRRRAPLVRGEVTDGYCSGDSVDDNIDRIGVSAANSAHRAAAVQQLSGTARDGQYNSR